MGDVQDRVQVYCTQNMTQNQTAGEVMSIRNRVSDRMGESVESGCAN